MFQVAGVFCGGDLVGSGTTVQAVNDGKTASWHMHRHIQSLHGTCCSLYTVRVFIQSLYGACVYTVLCGACAYTVSIRYVCFYSLYTVRVYTVSMRCVCLALSELGPVLERTCSVHFALQASVLHL